MMSGRRYLRAPLRVTTVVAMWAGSAAAKDEALETEAAPTETIAPTSTATSPGKFNLGFGLVA
jgi:cytoskeletal protein RodZ